MKKKFVIEFEYGEAEDNMENLKYSIEGVMEELLYDCLEVGQISDFNSIRVEEKL